MGLSFRKKKSGKNKAANAASNGHDATIASNGADTNDTNASEAAPMLTPPQPETTTTPPSSSSRRKMAGLARKISSRGGRGGKGTGTGAATSSSTTTASESSSSGGGGGSGSGAGVQQQPRATAAPAASSSSTDAQGLQAEPTLDMVPSLVDDLANAHDTSGDRPARALRVLFSLSEHAGGSERGGGASAARKEQERNRTAMVRCANGGLVPTLLDFLRRCERSSSEQYLALLVLNNVSIPAENKRPIAVEFGGAAVLSRLLCDDPGCHLLAIILVNLTFADAELRRELVSPSSSVQLVDALAYALLVSTHHPDSTAAQDPNYPLFGGVDGDGDPHPPPRKLLAAAVAAGHPHLSSSRSRSALTDVDGNDLASSASTGAGGTAALPPFDPAALLYPETARWCLCALKNLTRPSKDPVAAHALMDAGVVPLILKMITVVGAGGGVDAALAAQLSSHSDVSRGPVENDVPGGGRDGKAANDPSLWDANSLQDAALFTILNLSSTPNARSYLKEEGAVRVLADVADGGGAANRPSGDQYDSLDDAGKQRRFQCLKARMALGYLVGSEGHYGQPRSRSVVGSGAAAASTSSAEAEVPASDGDSLLVVRSDEAELLLDLLGNTLHQRAKEGPGGYSAATFTVKGALYAVRCLLSNAANQQTFASTCGVRLNALLLKALAQHSIQKVVTIDAEAGEYAAFSLYLQSNYGFKAPFLPFSVGDWNDDGNGSSVLSEKVWTSYLRVENVTPAGRHAAEQLLLRRNYLVFGGTATVAPGNGGSGPALLDYSFDGELLRTTRATTVESRGPGAKPRPDIFDRPILRSRAPKKGGQKAPLDGSASVDVYPSALHAVQELSFGSKKVRHVDAIDDVLIANNLASSANGERTESYNYWWSWQDTAQDIQSSLEGGQEFLKKESKSRSNDDEPFSIFGFRCGAVLCAQDSST